MRVKVKGKSHPNELCKNRRMEDAHWGERPEREGQIEELVGDQNPSPETSARSKIERERGEQLPEERWRRVCMSGQRI